MSKKDKLINRLIFRKYKLTNIIGCGSFGNVYKGLNINDKSYVAIKLERRNGKSDLLKIESNFLHLLKGYGIPELKGFGYSGNYNVLVQELLGDNLMQIKEREDFRYSLKDISMIAIQLMDRIEFVHSRYIIHRDIKPENFTIGYKNNSLIYIIDFGISRKYRSSHTGKHLQYSLTGKMFGTVRYASYNASRGLEQSRRDDLESIGYMLIYLFTNFLPWQGVNLRDHNRHKKYMEMLVIKKYLPPERLCRGLPIEFVEYIKYCKNLGFEEDPDYEKLRNLFRSILLKMNEINDMKFSFNMPSENLPIEKKKNLKDKDLFDNRRRDKYINLFKRKESPHQRLFRAIQHSLEKEKNSEKSRNINNNIKIEHKINYSFQKKRNDNSHREIKEDSTKNSKLDNLENSNNSKNLFSGNSLLAHYNMNVNEFQDEEKLFQENISLINSIRNKSIKSYSSRKNRNIIYTNDLSKKNIELNSYNLQSKNIIKSNLNKVFLLNKRNKIEKLDTIEKKFNISIDLDKSFLINSNLNEIKNIRSYSEKIKESLNKKKLLTNKEIKRQIYCKNIYDNILNKIKVYIDSLRYINKNNINKKKDMYNLEIKNNNNNNNKINNDSKIKIDFNEDNFSFKNMNIINNLKANNFKINTEIFHNRNNTINFNSINNNEQIKKKIYINNNIKRKEIKSNNLNFNIEDFLKNKNIVNSDNNINIIINNNINSNINNVNKPRINNNNNINQIQNNKPYYQMIPHSEYNMNNNNELKSKIAYKKNIYKNDNNNYNNFININQNENNIKRQTFISNESNPILQNLNYTSRKSSPDNKNNINSKIYLNNTQRIKNSPKIKNMKLMEYKSNMTEKSHIIDYNNKINSGKLNTIKIKRNSPNNNLLFSNKMKIIELNQENYIKTSPRHYNNNYKMNNNMNIKINNKIMNTNQNKIMQDNDNIYNNTIIYKDNINNNYLYNDNNIILRKGNNLPITNNQRIYLGLGKKGVKKSLKFTNSSDNLKGFLNTNLDAKNISLRNHRHSYDKQKKCLNYKTNNIMNLKYFNYNPETINKLNSPKRNNYIIPKCYNNL